MNKFGLSKETVKENPLSLNVILMSVGAAIACTTLLLLIFAAVITYTQFPQNYISAVVIISTILSVFVAGFFASKKARTKGWLVGMISGITYVLILYIIGCLVFTNFVFGIKIIYMLMLGAFVGIVGGIAGVNVFSRRRC